MKIYIIFILLAANAFAQNCDEDQQNLSSLAGQKCLTEDITKELLQFELTTADQAKTFCKNCIHPLLSKYKKSTHEQKIENEEKKTVYGKAVLNEFQKELTALSIDLMKSRSSFNMKFDPSKTIESCNFTKKLSKPTCLDENTFKSQTQKIQNGLATELSNIISGNQTGKNGLFTRPDKPYCENIHDSDVIFTNSRYLENLITPDFIKSLKAFKIPPNKSLEEFAKESTILNELPELSVLKNHPLFHSISKNTNDLIKFLKTIETGSSHDEIIVKLYSAENSTKLNKDLEVRCNDIFHKTSRYLEEIYCKDTPSYIADNDKSMQAISDSKFNNMTDANAEVQIRKQCERLDSANPEAISFSEVIKDIHKNYDSTLNEMPLSEYKKEAYTSDLGKSNQIMCDAANNPKCLTTESKTSACELVKIYNESKLSKQYSDMAKASNENINLILRSLVSDGIPQTAEGKPDTQAISLLKSEGILPGGTTINPRPPQQDASTFQKLAKAEKNSFLDNSAPNKPQSPNSVPPRPQAPTESQQTISNNDNSYAAPESQTSKLKPSEAPSYARKGLSDDEQAEILRRIKLKKPSTTSDDSKNSVGNSESSKSFNEPTGQNTFAANRPDSSTVPAAASAAPVNFAPRSPSGDGFSGNKATLGNSAQKKSSYEEAKIAANARPTDSGSTTSDQSDGSPGSISATSNAAAAKAEASTKTDSTVKDYKNKLEVLLNAKTQELSVSKQGDSFLIKLKNFEINVVFNKITKSYEAICPDKLIPKDYLSKISTYFNETLKERSGKRDDLLRALASP